MTQEHKELLAEYALRLNKSQIGHFISYEKYHRLDRLITYLSLAFSTITTGLLLYEVDLIDDSLYKNITIVCSILAVTTSSVLSFARFGPRAEQHKNRAAKYGSLKRSIENYLVLRQEEIKPFLEGLKTQWDLIADDSPVTTRSIRREAREEIRHDRKDNEEFIPSGNPTETP